MSKKSLRSEFHPSNESEGRPDGASSARWGNADGGNIARSRQILHWARVWAGAAVLGMALWSSPAWACQFDSDCPLGQLCTSGVCVSPSQENTSCDRDVECGPEQVCSQHRCVQAMPRFPGESATPPPPTLPAPQSDATPPSQQAPAPSAQPAPQPTETQPAPPPAEAQPAPSVQSAPPPQSAPPEYPPPPWRPNHPRLFKRHFRPHFTFDVYAGGSLVVTQTALTSLIAGGFSGAIQGGYRFAPNLELVLRGSAVLAPSATMLFSTFFGGPGLMFPAWNSGFIVGPANSTFPDGAANSSTHSDRETGFQITIPYEVHLTSFLKFAFDVSFGFYPDMQTQTIDLYLAY